MVESSDAAFDLNAAQFPPVGYCIYCGGTDGLTREHIVPKALNGTAVLPKASCKLCARITGQFEKAVLRGPMWAVRVLRGLRSRTKHADAPESFPLLITRDDQEEEIQLALDEYPILLHFPIFLPPAFLYPDGYVGGVRFKGLASVSFGQRPDHVREELNATSISIPSDGNEPTAFARMIAKIALGTAVAQGQIGEIDGDPFVVSAILGTSNDIGRWVGTLTKPNVKHPGVLHRADLHHDRGSGTLVAEIQLFADSETPSYGVILGNLK